MHYPFSPEILDALPEDLAELYRGLEDTLLEEICSRLKISDQLNEVTVADIKALRSRRQHKFKRYSAGGDQGSNRKYQQHQHAEAG